MIGNDGGLDISWDQGKTWDYVNTMATALAYCRDRRHAASVLRLHRAAGQRQLGRPERDARPRRHHELGLVRHRRRRRLPDRRRSDRLQHRLHRIAGRQHQPLRPAAGPRRRASVRAGGGAAAAADAAAAAAARGRGRRRAASGARPDAAAAAPPVQAAAGRLRRARRRAERAQRARRATPIASTGTRRSSCRRTTRASCGSAATGCSSRTTAATLGRERRSHEADRSQHGRGDGRAGQPHAALEERRRRRRTARSSRSRNRR